MSNPIMEDFTSQRVRPSKGARLHFMGREIATLETEPTGSGSWTEATLWETPAGNWILDVGIYTEREGHQDFTDAYVIEKAEDWRMQCAVMDALKWGIDARKMAKRLGWKFVRKVE